MTSDKVDIMMSQKSKNGANYIVIYQILCLMTLNTNGELATHVNGITMKWDDEKIQRECKWFDIDTIRIAKGLFLELGLLVLNDNGNLEIKDHHELIGYETGSAIDAKRKRAEKAKQNTVKKGNTKNVS
ncbi:MAG: hypothetical protein M0R51_14080 [Clostridia bacterium]|nr:hypothetical protein [Clostridia bacterium]